MVWENNEWERTANLELVDEIYRDMYLDAIKDGDWTMRNGKEINVREMSRSHIRNCIAMLERGNSLFADEWIERFKQELSFREYVEKIANGEL